MQFLGRKQVKRPLAFGIDLGGSKINILLTDLGGQIWFRLVLPTHAQAGLSAVLGTIYQGLKEILWQVIVEGGAPVYLSPDQQTSQKVISPEVLEALEDESVENLLQVLIQQGQEIRGIGLAVAGVINSERGLVYEAPNLDWRGISLRDLVAQETGLPVVLENDTNAAALAEYWYGAGKNANPFVYLGIGTGIGGGIIIDGKLLRGSGGGAGEVGHLAVAPEGPTCGSGHPGCLEAMVSGRALKRLAQEAVQEKAGENILRLAGGDLNRVSGETITAALAQGDVTAIGIVQQAGVYLGMGLSSIINLLNPARIVLGGGVAAELGKPLLEAAQPEMEARVFPALKNATQIVPAGLGPDSAALGAAALVHYCP